MAFDRTRSPGYMTNWAARVLAQAIDRELRPLGLSSGHMPVFFALGDGGEMTQKQLAAFASIEQPTMAATLARMERLGLVARRPDPSDGRVALVSLTPMAREKAVEVAKAADRVNAAATAGFSEKERAAYLKLLGKVVASFED